MPNCSAAGDDTRPSVSSSSLLIEGEPTPAAEANRMSKTLCMPVGLLVLAACGGGGTGPAPGSGPVASVTVTPNPAVVVAGGTLQLTSTTRNAAGNRLTGRVWTWPPG